MAELDRLSLETPEQTSSIRTSHDVGLPFALARSLSWISLVLILISSLVMAMFIGNTARDTLLARQQSSSKQLALNLNQQIYRRFTLPTVLAFGRVALRQPMQYEQLDNVIRSSIQSVDIGALRIYGQDKIVNYSLNADDLGRDDLVPVAAEQAIQTKGIVFEILSNISWIQSMFAINLPPRSFTLRTSFPLSVDMPSDEGNAEEALITGVLELTQDITDDYSTAIRFQWLIWATCLGAAAVLFGILQFFIIRAEGILAERMTRNRKLEAELHQNEKLVSMGRVIASIAHEIRNPLGIIRSSAELLLRRTSETDVVNRKMLSAVYDEAFRLSQTVNDFLDYARPRVPNSHSIDLILIVTQILTFLEGECARLHVDVHTNLPPKMLIKADKDLLYRALYNVISNALQAMGTSSEQNTADPVSKRLYINGMVAEKHVELTVIDTGSGFDETMLPRVLDPFFTTKDHGTGLGLPIVNTIITSHGGELRLGNTPNGGAFVKIYLPCL